MTMSYLKFSTRTTLDVHITNSADLELGRRPELRSVVSSLLIALFGFGFVRVRWKRAGARNSKFQTRTACMLVLDIDHHG